MTEEPMVDETLLNKEQATIDSMAAKILDWDDEKLAGRIVGLLILDEGHLNKYQRTIELMLKIVRSVERQKATGKEAGK